MKNEKLTKVTDLESLSDFIDQTKAGKFTAEYPEILDIKFGRIEISDFNLEVNQMYIENPQVLLFGLTH